MSHDTLRVRLLAFLFLIPLALYDDLLRQARRIVSADDTQWLNHLLDAGHGESR